MKRLIAIISVIAAFGCLSISAKTPAELVTAFKNVLPTGQKSIMAWAQKDGNIYVVDSDTGVIRKITAVSSWCPKITQDRTRILYLSSGKLYSINWNGSGNKLLNSAGYDKLEGYCYDIPTKTDYCILRTGGNYSKVNGLTGASASFAGAGDDGCAISLDGKYVAADFGGFGLMNVATSNITKPTTVCGTCNCNISPDNTYRLMIQYAGHNAVCVNSVPGITTGGTIYSSKDGKSAQNITESILKTNPHSGNCVSQGYDYGFEATNWVAPDIVVFIMTNSLQNPYMVKLSDPTKWVAIDDNLGCNIDQNFMTSPPDAKIFDRGSSSISNVFLKQLNSKSTITKQQFSSYLPDGRRISQSAFGKRGFHGITINRLEGSHSPSSLITVVQ